jgi:hypothetical protein
MKTATRPIYRVIRKSCWDHIFYREQYTNRIAVADQSCVDREGGILPPYCQDDASHGVLYIDFKRINKWDLPEYRITAISDVCYALPVVGEYGDEFTVLITKAELNWLRRYF